MGRDAGRAPRTPGEGPAALGVAARVPLRPVVFKEPAWTAMPSTCISNTASSAGSSGVPPQGFIRHDRRACLAQSADAIPRVILLGRLSLYGPGADRLHEDIVSITARWIETARRPPPSHPMAGRRRPRP